MAAAAAESDAALRSSDRSDGRTRLVGSCLPRGWLGHDGDSLFDSSSLSGPSLSNDRRVSNSHREGVARLRSQIQSSQQSGSEFPNYKFHTDILAVSRYRSSDTETISSCLRVQRLLSQVPSLSLRVLSISHFSP